jgi:hypothetical protein
VDVGIAPFAERIGQRLDVAERDLERLRGEQGAKTSSTARSRRVATRMSCTRSMSTVSRTPSSYSKSSAVRTRTMRAPASA